ncbi:hypothetical protein [Mesorhizobium australicum]|uniref:Uncharacterized protein n=1 Tax=Mesorhizobium australicum TaxID=536018 RepID=A0A1X7NG32_9HYPH|nr:hypothetical protein [Mesorhizobium australicum]SMH36070.1 hypothetical protein SAMN02982922_1686 [Mesorhizobium australicum]
MTNTAETAKLPEIQANSVSLQAAGHVWKEVLVRLPDGYVADDLKEPGIWAKVQGSRWSLRKFDKVLVVAFDESWCAEARVVDADQKKAVLGGIKVISMPARFDALLNDGTYRVVWLGGDYGVERIRDGHIVARGAVNPQHAERLLFQQYPSRAA